MLKYLFVAGLAWALISYLPDIASHDLPASTTPAEKQATALLTPTFWQQQAAAHSQLWKNTLKDCQQSYQDRHDPSVQQGVCTIVLSVYTDAKLAGS